MKKSFLHITTNRVTDSRTAYHIEDFTQNGLVNPEAEAADLITDEITSFPIRNVDFMN